MFISLNKEIKRICIIGNQHGLLQYLMLSSLEDISHTFFLWNYVGLPDSVVAQFGKHGTFIPNPNNMLLMRLANRMKGIFPIVDAFIGSFFLFFFYRIYYPLKFPFILSSKYEYWGHDHVINAHCFLRNHSFRLLEDGTANYVPYPFIQAKQSNLCIKRFLAGKNYGQYLKYMGEENRCSVIFLTGLSDKGEVLKDPKVRVKSFVEMWNESDIYKRRFINDVFAVSTKLISECTKYKHILLTEPLSESGLLSEDEKIDLFRTILKRIGRDDIVIKPHPREKTDYFIFFPNNCILKTSAPMQLLTLNGIRFEAAYSIRSSALFDFPYKIKVCVLGTEIHPVLLERLPDWTSDKIKKKIRNSNVELIDI